MINNSVLKLDYRLSELAGIIIGDGCLYHKNSNYLITIAGNIDEDREYYNYISEMIFRLIQKRPIIKIHQRALRLNLKNKLLFNFFFEYLGMMYDGNKTYDVVIPSLILKTPVFTKACLRGIVDTDGSVFVSDKPGSPEYPSIEITTVSKNLAFQLRHILLNLGYRATLRWHDPKNDFQVRTYKLGLNGWDMLMKWQNDIGFSHPLKRLRAETIIRKKKWDERDLNTRH